MGLLSKEAVGRLFEQTLGPARTSRLVRFGDNIAFEEPKGFARIAVGFYNRHNRRDESTLDDEFEIVAGALSGNRVYIRGDSKTFANRNRTLHLMRRTLGPEIEVFDFTDLSSPITRR